MDRKTFIKNALVGAAAFTIVPRHVLGGNGYLAPSDRLNLGFIGTGKQAGGLLWSIVGCPEPIAVAACDVDSKKLQHFISSAKKVDRKSVV